MDANFKEILDGLPDKPPHSRLEPCRELIRELRGRGPAQPLLPDGA
jgi:hypothetical protein